MQHKYMPLPKTDKVKGDGRFGRYVNPDQWKTRKILCLSQTPSTVQL